MITHAAAKDVARQILKCVSDDVRELEVSLAASLIVKAVERDEMEQKAPGVASLSGGTVIGWPGRSA